MAMHVALPVSPAASKLFLALDTSSLQVATDHVDQTFHLGIGYKIGLELIHAGHGPSVARHIRQKGFINEIFYDPKVSDTTSTMKGAVRNIAGLGVEYFNVHAMSGPDSVSAAASVKGDSKMLAVTVLTTITPEQYFQMFVAPFLGILGGTMAKEFAEAGLTRSVVAFAKGAKENGADGIVCSALEVAMLMSNPETASMVKIIPGTRMPGADPHEQKRVGTQVKAIEDGGWENTFLVIGREATEASNPVAVLMNIMEAIMPYAPQH